MKMVSQLTRQAIHRHQLLAANASCPAVPPAQPPATVAQPTGFQMVQPLYSGAESAPSPSSISSPPPLAAERPAPPPVRRNTVYQQLMSSHDRMTERHLRRT